MPGVNRLTVDKAVEAAKMAFDLGIPALATFANIPIGKRDATGSAVLDPNGVVNASNTGHQKGCSRNWHHYRCGT